MTNETDFSLGKDDKTNLFSTLSSCKQLTTSMLSQAENKVSILSHHLDSAIFDDEDVREAISKLARKNHRSEIRLLVADERPLVSQTQRLIELMRRLSSRISLKVINKAYPYDNSSMILVDRYGVMFQKDNSVYDGFANFNDPGRVKQLSEIFDTLWGHAADSQEMRQLKL
jgi:hypothetical protein